MLIVAEKETETTSGQEKPTPKAPSYDPGWDLPPLRMDYMEQGAVRRPSPITQKNDKTVREEK
jgi:hypothetical protein